MNGIWAGLSHDYFIKSVCVLMTFVILSGIVSLVLVYFLSRSSSPLVILDRPNERSLHSKPISRTGGLGILAGIVVSGLLLISRQGYPEYLVSIFAGVMLIAVVSLVDDKRGVSVRYRLLAHTLAAVVLMSNGFYILNLETPFFVLELYPWLAYVFTFVLILWSINLFNFMDGMDGFAGGMAFIGFSVFAVLGLLKGASVYAVLAAIIACANGTFLLFNFPPARIFMGDTGSSVLGFLMAVMMIWADSKGIFPLWIGILVFSPFILDASLTLLRRAFNGEKIWLAHRDYGIWHYAGVCGSGAVFRLFYQSTCPIRRVYCIIFVLFTHVLLFISLSKAAGKRC